MAISHSKEDGMEVELSPEEIAAIGAYLLSVLNPELESESS